MREVTGYVKLD